MWSIETSENHNLQYLNNLFYKCIDLNNNEYDKGFWVYRYDKNFYFEYELEEGCQILIAE